MMRHHRSTWIGLGFALALAIAAPAGAQPLTVAKAVEMALARSTQMVNADANLVNARSGVYSAYSGILPSLSAEWTRSGELTTGGSGIRPLIPPTAGYYYSSTKGSETYSTSPTLVGSWSVLNLASLQSVSSARHSLTAAKLRVSATRAQVALDTRGLFYNVVRAEHLAEVSTDAARLARDDERRVNALFEVGSVSRSDLLKAQVRTAQAQLDSISRHLAITNERVALARQLGLRESEMPEVDSVLTALPQAYDETQLLEEARANRPDIKALEAELHAARGGLRAANLARLPFVSLRGSGTWDPRTSTKQTYVLYDANVNPIGELPISSHSGLDRDLSGSVSLTWNLFTGMQTEAQIGRARAHLLLARDARDVALLNLQAEVHQALLSYRESAAGLEVAERGLASAEENVRLTQEKYNVGAATILELIDAQVQLQQARSDRVSALASIRLAEASLDRVRGRNE